MSSKKKRRPNVQRRWQGSPGVKLLQISSGLLPSLPLESSPPGPLLLSLDPPLLLPPFCRKVIFTFPHPALVPFRLYNMVSTLYVYRCLIFNVHSPTNPVASVRLVFECCTFSVVLFYFTFFQVPLNAIPVIFVSPS